MAGETGTIVVAETPAATPQVEAAAVIAHAEVAEAAAVVAVAAAEQVQTLAQTQAAQVAVAAAEEIEEQEDDIEWLREHAERTDVALGELSRLSSEQGTRQQAILDSQTEMKTLLSSLIRPPQETEQPETVIVQPEALPETPPPEKPSAPPKRKRRWI